MSPKGFRVVHWTTKKLPNTMTTPQVHLTTKKSRVKIYGFTYYLQNGTEFEFELFNPCTETVCAEITINGKTEDSGLVLKPGQKVFLERFMNNNRKFKFETYKVDANDKSVDAAIANNGDITVRFYKEVKRPAPKPYSTLSKSKSKTGSITNNPLYGNGSDYFYSMELNKFGGPGSCINSSMYLRSDFSNEIDFSPNASTVTTDSIDFGKDHMIQKETGRVEQGNISEQSLVTVDTKFESYAFVSTTFKILPLSQKPEDEEVAMYCSECGRRAKKNENFCPKCGNNLSEQRKNL